MATPAIQTLLTDAQQVLNLNSLSEVRATMAAALANANVGTPLNPNLTTQQLWDEFYLIVRQPESDIESIITNQLMKFLFAPPAPGGAGADQQVIFNDGGVLAGDPQFLWNKTTNLLTVTGSATITGALTVGTGANAAVQKGSILGGYTVFENSAGTGNPSITFNNDIDTGLLNPTANTIAFAIGGSEAMRLNSTGLGVGASPATKLDVRGTINGNQAIFTGTVNRGLVISTRSDGLADDRTVILNAQHSTGSQGQLVLQTVGTDRLLIDSTGNVGVGVTPSAWQSTIYKVLEFSRGVSLSGQTDAASMELTCNAYIDSAFSWIYKTTAAATHYRQFNGAHQWHNAPSGTAGNAITFTQAMTLDASGNLSLASGYVRAAARTQIGAGYIGDINIAGNNRGLFFGSTGLLPANGTGTVSDNSYNLGSGTERWATVYAGTGTINTSDRNEKQAIADLSASEKRVASSIKQLVKKYRFKDAVASKGENARIHVGWIAQDVQSAFAAEGLDASDYGMFCSDSWYEVNGSSVDSDGKPYTSESENAVAKTRLGLRHDELLAFVVSSL